MGVNLTTYVMVGQSVRADKLEEAFKALRADHDVIETLYARKDFDFIQDGMNSQHIVFGKIITKTDQYDEAETLRLSLEDIAINIGIYYDAIQTFAETEDFMPKGWRTWLQPTGLLVVAHYS